MARATAFWSSALQVHRAVEPLRAERTLSRCHSFSFDKGHHCERAEAPTCGNYGFTIPDKYLKAARTCSDRCSPQYKCRYGTACVSNNECACDVDAWSSQKSDYCCRLSDDNGCGINCTDQSLLFVGRGTSGGVVCESGCVEHAEGPGLPDKDLHIFVSIKDTDACGDDTQAYASWCTKDQCDRPIFASINFCKSKVSNVANMIDDVVSTAVHELAHAMAFSSSLFKFFRHADGSPRLTRDALDQDVFPGEVRWSCDSSSFAFPDPYGNNRYVDLMPNILSKFSERGLDNCPCPIGTLNISSSCFVPQSGFRVPSCVLRVTTPTVLAEAKAHFACSSLEGAELENQDTSVCSIVGSHWEQRVFNGELMAPLHSSIVPVHLSRVTLALFQDSGWYQVDMSKADPLTVGVHWGYQRGCSFAMQACATAGVPVWDRAFCSDSSQAVCSLSRTHVVKCTLSTLSTDPPDALNYLGSRSIGTLDAIDYCPAYLTTLTNRVCSDPVQSTYVPYSNVNAMREIFSSSSRCLMSTLRAKVPGYSSPDPSHFASEYPVCYETVCSADRRSYSVMVADIENAGKTILIGTCATEGQLLSSSNFDGKITCASPVELCQLFPPKHVATLPSNESTDAPTPSPSLSTSSPTPAPTFVPTPVPSLTVEPSVAPSPDSSFTSTPIVEPTAGPTSTVAPSVAPTRNVSQSISFSTSPTSAPTITPTEPTHVPTAVPSESPIPSRIPTSTPTIAPSTLQIQIEEASGPSPSLVVTGAAQIIFLFVLAQYV
eukprot:TRINITY_DN21922_c0_g1_i1.p1 TRINITY_DN21922_c0_g1~~TRINITY_DN21922_c0_g1_i1.p1  ORF type:complete len:893 (-),score=41.28 TRINITY_DN21922_c0_g1_i1:364-2682(-)